MDTLINFLINNSDKYDLDIIDDSENHDMIFYRIPQVLQPLHVGDVKLLNIKEIKYNTYTHKYVICYKDDLEIGYIPNVVGKSLLRS